MENKGSTKEVNTIKRLVPALYTLAIGSMILNESMKPMFISESKERRRISKLLRRRGLIRVEIIDKDSEMTYQEIKGLENNLKLFIKLNKGKWKLERKKYYNIDEGIYVLTRIYRKYNKKDDGPNFCKECGSILDDD